MPTSQLIKETRSEMEKSLESMVHEFATVRTGKANPALLDSIRVDAYGAKSPLTHVANVSAPQPNMIVVQPWDKSLVGPIDKAIRLSDLGLNPTNDGQNINIVIPPLNEERRKDLTRAVRKMAEEGRVSIRNHRRDAIELLRMQEKDSEISEDDSRRGQKEVQEITDEFIKKVDEALEKKEAEIMEV
jgi:ribosome recycling factor